MAYFGREIVANLAPRQGMCRSYQERSVPREHLEELLDYARRSPSAGHSQAVRFVVVTKQTLRYRIAELFGEPSYVSKGRNPWLSAAPVHLVVAYSNSAYQSRYSEADKRHSNLLWPIPYGVLDAGKALMKLYMAAGEFGLSYGYLGPHAGPDLVSELSLPADWTFVGLVTLGYRKEKAPATASQRRGWRPIEEVVLWLD